MNVKQLGVYMREKRLASGKSIRQVAHYLGLDPGMISRFERGQRVLRPENLAKLCEYYNVEISTVEKKPEPDFRPSLGKEPVFVQCDRCLTRKKIWI